jgi:hypothetical protein
MALIRAETCCEHERGHEIKNTCSQHVSALIKGHLQMILYNTKYLIKISLDDGLLSGQKHVVNMKECMK